MHIIIGILVIIAVILLLSIALEYVFNFLLLIFVNMMSIIDSLLSEIGNYSWILKLENGKISQISEKAGIFFNKISTPYPFVAWAIFGFIFGAVGYFYVKESNKLNRPLLKTGLLVLVFFIFLSNLFVNSSSNTQFSSMKTNDLIFNSSPLNLEYEISDKDNGPILFELRRPGYYKLSTYDKTFAYQTSIDPNRFPISVTINGINYVSDNTSIFKKPFKINEPSIVKLSFKYSYKNKTYNCFFKIFELNKKPENYINIPILSKNNQNLPKNTAEKSTSSGFGRVLYCSSLDGINLRSGTSTSDNILGKIFYDEKVTVFEQIDKNDGNLYYRVQKENGLTGWAWGGTKGKKTFSSLSDTVTAATKFSTMKLREKNGLKLNATISCIETNKSCGTYNFEELECKGRLVFKRSDNSYYYFTESNETPGCVAGCSLAISKNGKQYKESCGSLNVEGNFN